jgi:hypothetical protein
MVTVLVAVVLAAIGVVLAWPIDSLVSVLAPLDGPLRTVGLGLTRETGFLCLFLSPALLVVGSLLPQI